MRPFCVDIEASGLTVDQIEYYLELCVAKGANDFHDISWGFYRGIPTYEYFGVDAANDVYFSDYIGAYRHNLITVEELDKMLGLPPASKPLSQYTREELLTELLSRES